MGCQNSKVRSASTTEATPFKPAVAKDVLASRTFSLPPASPISSPARSRRASDADSQHAATVAATAAAATAVPTTVAVEPEVPLVETSAAPTEVPKIVAVPEEAPTVADGSNVDAVEAVAVVAEEDERVDAEATVATAVTATEEAAPVVDEAAPIPSTVTFVEEAKPEEEVDEKKDEAEEAPAAVAAVAMEERPKSATNVRRVAFDKETMRRTAPRSAPAVPPAGTHLTKKQQQMYQAGHKSAGRRGPVASKHSRCKAQMQEDVYLAMANAFERLLTNVNTIDAHLDSR